ncbi:Crp/Fnr family transcriptional regulator [Streptomyces chartreusis]|uniref:Crp/Fnr family transcriptional regulator n=1 Tax=Streptomyces chartreusis TaxID=1969 RepID=UPI0037F3C759
MPPRLAPPTATGGPLGALLGSLRQLHTEAGQPSVRKIAASAQLSHDTVHRVLTQAKTPTWPSLEAVVSALDGSVEQFRTLWVACRAQEEETPGAPMQEQAGFRSVQPRHNPRKLSARDEYLAPPITTQHPPIAPQAGQRWPAQSFLHKLKIAQREQILRLGTTISYEPGEMLAREGENATLFCLILSGYVHLTATADNGTIVFLDVRGPGDLIGELGGHLNASTVTAAQRVYARRIHSSALLQFLQQHPDATLSLAEVITERLRKANRRRLDIAAYPAMVRLARILVEFADSDGPAVQGTTAPLSQRDLASLAGVTLPTVEKALRKLRADGVLARGYRSVSISDMPRLRRLAGY